MTSEHEDATSDQGRGGDEGDTEKVPRQSDSENTSSKSRSRSKSPAYVAPIPKIGLTPPVVPEIGLQISPSDRPAIPASIGSLLVGKLVDEDGDIIDEKTGTLLAHAGGDLPSIVGRRVSNTRGDILADDGHELLGYVADIEVPKAAAAQPPRSLFDLMGRATSSLMVDHQGNILDATGAVVGRFHDNNNPLHRKEREEREARQREEGAQSHQQTETGEDGQRPQQRSLPPTPSRPAPPQQEQESQPASGDGQRRPPRRTEEERRQNAEAWRKENPGESPSDIFLDVKSTTEGIQLTIRIPTVFNGQQRTPHISFS